MAQTIFTVNQVLSITDAITQHVDVVQAALDAGKTKADLLISRVQNAGVANSDIQTVAALYPQLSKYDSGANAQAWFGGVLRRLLVDINTQIRTTGSQVNAAIVDLDRFATYYNGLTPYSCLFSWEFALCYYWSQAIQLSPGNVYCPGGPVNANYSFTTGYGQAVTQAIGFQLAHGSINAGVSSFTADNGGAVPAANTITPYVQGYAPVNVELYVGPTAIAGTGNASLVFTGTNQAGVVKQWTVPVVNAGVGTAAGTVLAMPPATNGDRLRTITSVAVTGTLTAGDWAVRVKQEAGRPG